MGAGEIGVVIGDEPPAGRGGKLTGGPEDGTAAGAVAPPSTARTTSGEPGVGLGSDVEARTTSGEPGVRCACDKILGSPTGTCGAAGLGAGRSGPTGAGIKGIGPWGPMSGGGWGTTGSGFA